MSCIFKEMAIERGRKTFGTPEMLEIKLEWLKRHADALPTPDFKRMMSVAFDEFWIGEKLNNENDDYIAIEELDEMKKFAARMRYRMPKY